VGARVRLDLNDAGRGDVAPYLGGQTKSLEGSVTLLDSAGLELTVSSITRLTDSEESWPGSVVRVPGNGIAGVTLSRISTAKSLLAAGGLFVGSGVIARAIGGGSALGSSGSRGGTGR
jgi:hypothetical protein